MMSFSDNIFQKHNLFPNLFSIPIFYDIDALLNRRKRINLTGKFEEKLMK